MSMIDPTGSSGGTIDYNICEYGLTKADSIELLQTRLKEVCPPWTAISAICDFGTRKTVRLSLDENCWFYATFLKFF